MRFLSHKMRRVGSSPEPVTGVSAGVLPSLIQSMAGTHTVPSGSPEWTLDGIGSFSTETYNGSALCLSTTDPSEGYVAASSNTFQMHAFDTPSNPDIANTSLVDNRTFTAAVSFWVQGGFWTPGGGHYFILQGAGFESRIAGHYVRDPGEDPYTFPAYTMASAPSDTVDLSSLFSADRVGGLIIDDTGVYGAVACTIGGTTTMRRFSMSTAFDLSTAQEDVGQVGTLAGISPDSNDESFEYQPMCARVDPSGLAMFLLAQYNNGSDYIAIREYTMPTPMDIANLTYTGREVDLTSLPVSSVCFSFDFTRGVANGDHLIVASTNRIHQASIT